MGFFDALFGGTDTSAMDAQIAANERALQFIKEMGAQARGDVLQLAPATQETRRLGFQGALDVLGQTIPQQLAAFQAGSMGAQQALLAGLPQQQAAILGTPVDLSGLQPQAISYDPSFAQQQLPAAPDLAALLAGFTAQLPSTIAAANAAPAAQVASGGDSMPMTTDSQLRDRAYVQSLFEPAADGGTGYYGGPELPKDVVRGLSDQQFEDYTLAHGLQLRDPTTGFANMIDDAVRSYASSGGTIGMLAGALQSLTGPPSPEVIPVVESVAMSDPNAVTRAGQSAAIQQALYGNVAPAAAVTAPAPAAQIQVAQPTISEQIAGYDLAGGLPLADPTPTQAAHMRFLEQGLQPKKDPLKDAIDALVTQAREEKKAEPAPKPAAKKTTTKKATTKTTTKKPVTRADQSAAIQKAVQSQPKKKKKKSSSSGGGGSSSGVVRSGTGSVIRSRSGSAIRFGSSK